jgi:hypothetical protein
VGVPAYEADMGEVNGAAGNQMCDDPKFKFNFANDSFFSRPGKNCVDEDCMKRMKILSPST